MVLYNIAEVCSSSGISLESFLRLWNTFLGTFHRGTGLFVDIRE